MTNLRSACKALPPTMASLAWPAAPPPCSERNADERDDSPEAPTIKSPTRLRQGTTPPRPGATSVFAAFMDEEEGAIHAGDTPPLRFSSLNQQPDAGRSSPLGFEPDFDGSFGRPQAPPRLRRNQPQPAQDVEPQWALKKAHLNSLLDSPSQNSRISSLNGDVMTTDLDDENEELVPLPNPQRA